MDEKKISFIVRKQNDIAYDELLQYLGQLQIPKGYQVDIVTIESDAGKAAVYNQGMKQSDAKYKIYMDEWARILKRDFLQSMLEVFQQDGTIGILGVAGNLVIPTNAICREGLKRTGRLICGEKNEAMNWGNFEGKYQEVMALDDCLLMTQQDIPWREDLFAADCFYDTAQCIEFKRRGYKAAVMSQDDYWVQDRRNDFDYDLVSQNVFWDEYSEDIYPKVLIIITTFNRPQYLKEALESVICQGYRNLEIVISDDSTNDLTEKMMKEYLQRDSRIRYVKHEDYTAMDNGLWTYRYIKNSNIEYINFWSVV